mgnify:CR=1 FL=1
MLCFVGMMIAVGVGVKNKPTSQIICGSDIRTAGNTAKQLDASLRDSLACLEELRRPLAGHPSPLLGELWGQLEAPVEAIELLLRAIAQEPAAMVRDGGVMATGFDAELDELRAIQSNCDGFLLELEAREKARSQIPNLRVQYNKVHGFYIEVTSSHLDKIPPDYRRRQTLKNAERFITPELKAFEDKALSAQERALQREKWLYEQVLEQLQPHVPALTRLAQALAQLDVLCCFAERSLTLQWCAPQFVEQPCIDIEAGRHPVVEARLAQTSAGSFIANHTRLHPGQRLHIITGPNMGGKSTYMRQVALIALLASIGSHVPASSCRLGPLDAIHTRIGAADDLANGVEIIVLLPVGIGQVPAAKGPPPRLAAVDAGADAGGLVLIDDQAVAPVEVAEHEVRVVVDVVIRREQRRIDAVIRHVLADGLQAPHHLLCREGRLDLLAVAREVHQSFAFQNLVQSRSPFSRASRRGDSRLRSPPVGSCCQMTASHVRMR